MRLDLYLTQNFNIQSRNKANELIKASKVKVNKKIISKASFIVEDDMNIELLEEDFYVSRAAYKLKYFLDEIKIDKSFIQNYEDKKKSTIIEAIYAISRVYEYKIVAEGVETIDQLEYLKEIGIQICQGYLFDKPMPFHKLLEKI